LSHRFQNKTPLVSPWMGQSELRALSNFRSKGNQVQIQRTSFILNSAPASPQVILNLLKRRQ